MQLDQESCYQALVSRDARFDGLMFVGVSSTGIYCRLICNSRRPLRRNCSFYSNAAAAEQAGYRPCLRCRPELAPGNALVDSHNRLAVAGAGQFPCAGVYAVVSNAGTIRVGDEVGIG